MADKKQKDFTTHWIFAYYEDGMAVSKIAHEVKLTEQRVYEKMRRHPEEIYNPKYSHNNS